MLRSRNLLRISFVSPNKTRINSDLCHDHATQSLVFLKFLYVIEITHQLSNHSWSSANVMSHAGWIKLNKKLDLDQSLVLVAFQASRKLPLFLGTSQISSKFSVKYEICTREHTWWVLPSQVLTQNSIKNDFIFTLLTDNHLIKSSCE